MKNLVATLFALLLLFLTACKDKEPTAPEEEIPAEGVLSEKTIGPEGGTLETNEFVLSIPEGAFLTNAEVKLFEEKENPFGENSVSKLFRVEGIPDDYKKQLKISISYSGSLSGENAIAIGKNTYDVYSDSTFLIYDIYPATESNGTLNCELAPLNSNLKINNYNKTSGSDVTIWVNAWTKGSEDLPSHFRYIQYSTHLSESQKFALRDFLEELYLKYKNMGFNYDRRLWPVRVDITNGSDFARLCIPKKDKEESYLKFIIPENYDILSDLSLIESVYTFIVSNMYWPNDASAEQAPDFFWLDIALKIWSEFQYKNWNEYSLTSTYFQSMVERTMKGFNNSTNTNTSVFRHGEAMALVLQYLEKNHTSKVFGKIYNSIGDGKHHIQAIIDAVGSPLDWLHNYYKYIIESSIFKAALGDYWVKNSKEEITINNAFTSKTITDNFFDLSGKWYKININNDIPIDKNLIIESGADNFEHVHISIFSFKDNDLKFWGDGESAVEIEDIKSFADAGEGLIVLISNGLTTPPTHKGTIDITTEFRFLDTQIPEFTNCSFEFKIERTRHISYLGYEEDKTDTVIFGDGSLREANFSSINIGENSFTGIWDYEGLPSPSYNTYATVYAEFNEDRTMINRLEIKKEVKPKDETKADESKYEIIITDIPLTHTNYYYYLGPDDSPCDHINVFTDIGISDLGDGELSTSEMTDFKCIDDSYIEIQFK